MTPDNKTIIQSALGQLMQSGDVGALEPFLHSDFLHHRPGATRNKQEWLTAVRAVPLARLRVDVRHWFADGAFVVMHSNRSLATGGAEVAGVDIWRVESGQIMEAWELLEPIDEAAAHFLWWQRASAETG